METEQRKSMNMFVNDMLKGDNVNEKYSLLIEEEWV